MFVPSLSWQNDRFYIIDINGSKKGALRTEELRPVVYGAAACVRWDGRAGSRGCPIAAMAKDWFIYHLRKTIFV